ncbi:hypothetical protein EBR44_15160, partial [bacterium]|nr:hypothetical protein [bacterium]
MLAAAAAAACGAPAFAQTVNAPVQYWIDLATYSMMGMEEMPDMPAGMMGNVTGMRSQTGRDGRHAAGVGNFGQTKNASMGRWMDTALFTQKKPSGTEATHQVPSGATLGAAPLQLMTPPRESLPAREEAGYPERPTGRLLFYWGCGAQVRAGQPRVMDFSKLGQADYNNFMQGRSVRDRGARAEPGHAIWPNDRQNSRVARTALSAASFSADGKWLAFSSLRVEDPEHVFRKSIIYAANTETGEIRALTKNNGTNSSPIYSPDGKMIAFMNADS